MLQIALDVARDSGKEIIYWSYQKAFSNWPRTFVKLQGQNSNQQLVISGSFWLAPQPMNINMQSLISNSLALLFTKYLSLHTKAKSVKYCKGYTGYTHSANSQHLGGLGTSHGIWHHIQCISCLVWLFPKVGLHIHNSMWEL